MAQRSFSTSTCRVELSQRRSLTLKLSNCKQKSEDENHTHSKPYSTESDRLRRIQSFKHNRKSSRGYKVMYPVDLQASTPELTFSDLRTFGNNKGFLCDKEEKFQKKRKLYIHTALQKILKIELKGDDVPHIALMGSGGGYRAMVAMSGIINALYNSKVLDCILYTAVLSGSSWFIATLYSHPDWPNIDPKDIQTQLKHDISTNPKSFRTLMSYVPDFVLGFFAKKLTGKAWNCTMDIFSPMLGNVLISDRLKCKWSEQEEKLSKGTVPLPLLSAIHAKVETNANEFHGICGSAFTLTHEEWANKDSSNFINKQTSVKSSRQYSTTQHKKEKQLDKKKSVPFDEVDGPPRKQDNYDNDIESSEFDVLESGCTPHSICVDLTPIKESNAGNFTENDDVFDDGEKEQRQEMEDLFKRICQIRKEGGRIFEEERTRNERVVGDSFKEGITEADEVDGFFGDMKLWAELYCIKSRCYRAAMVNNFLRKVSFDDTDSCHLQGETNTLFENYLKKDIENLCLIDAGLAFNSPYPLLFQPGRDVDLILSFDFTDRKKDSNDPFKTLLTAEDWARKHEIKFPKINVDKYEGKNVQELYIFEDENDPECPIIMHFVLVNKDFRTYKKPGVKRNESEKEFANFTVYDDQKTFNCKNFQYSAENFDRLSQLSEFIVLNNIVHIKACITKSIQNKQKWKQTGRQRHPSSPV